MKDFTKQETKTSNTKQHLKCSVCGVTVLAFGMEVGDTCRMPIAGVAGSGGTHLCSGTLRNVNSASVDKAKRRTDGAA